LKRAILAALAATERHAKNSMQAKLSFIVVQILPHGGYL